MCFRDFQMSGFQKQTRIYIDRKTAVSVLFIPFLSIGTGAVSLSRDPFNAEMTEEKFFKWNTFQGNNLKIDLSIQQVEEFKLKLQNHDF